MFDSPLDRFFFIAYLAATLLLGLWVARRGSSSSRDYFLAGERLPWYAIGGSIIAANISTEHFIGMVGAAYAAGFVVAQWEWGNWFTFSALIWIFLPYYLRGGIYTMPEFLERRFNKTCRYIFALASLVLWIVAQMAVVLLAGAKAMDGMFGVPPLFTIVGLAILAGSYTIYGGLISVAWTDFLQFIVLMVGGLVVAAIGLARAGGLTALMAAAPEKFHIFFPANHPDYPWFGVFTLFLSIGIWYNCTNQFIVQRCLGARSEWDARMGVLFAGYMKILLPFLVVLPGIVAFQLFPGLSDPDQAYPVLVKNLVPAGLGGIVMAGIASALLSHLSSVLNSSSTVFTMDLYRPLARRTASDDHLVRVGRWSAFVILVIATALALYMSRGKHSVFLLIQNVGAWVAAPISVIFLLGALWKRATAQAATAILVFGFPYTALVEYVLFKHIPWLMPYDNWLNRTFAVWATCLLAMVVLSYLTPKPAAEKIAGTTWSPAFLRLPESERHLARGARSLVFWWVLLVVVVAVLYAYLGWFQLHAAAARTGATWIEFG